MPSIEQFKRVIQPIIWVVDTSASMAGERIRTVRQIISEHLKELEPYKATLDIQVGLLTFNDRATWGSGPMFESPEDIMIEEELSTTGGMTDIGDAFQELNRQLSAGIFEEESSLRRCPLIVFVLDGYATDAYEPALEALHQNHWFQKAIKIGLALGDEADLELLKAVVGEKAVFSSMGVFADALHKITAEMNLSEKAVQAEPQQPSADKQTIIGDISEYAIQLPYNEVPLPNHLDICRCELCPCSPENAKDIVLSLSVEDNSIKANIIDSSVCASVAFYVPAWSKGTLPVARCHSFEVLEGHGAVQFKLIYDAENNVILIDNHMAYSMAVQINTIHGMVVTLNKNDSILDQAGKTVLTVIRPNDGWDESDWA